MTETVEEFDENIDNVDDALTALQAEMETMKDKYLRLVAEMQNVQKRAQRDIEDANKYGVVSAAKPFLAVADNLARALQALPAQIDSNLQGFVDGLRITQRDLQTALERMGVVAIKAEPGQALNPHEHEVMFEVPSDTHENGTLVQVLEAGYKIHDRLLRPARVSVAKNMGGNAAVDLSA